jgi:hypothetical protein
VEVTRNPFIVMLTAINHSDNGGHFPSPKRAVIFACSSNFLVMKKILVMPQQPSRKLAVVAIVIGLCFLLPPHLVKAQPGWSLEFRPAVNFPAKKLGTVDLKTGAGLEGIIAYRFMPHLGVYAGWGWNKFSEEETTANGNLDYEETGYSLGLQFTHPIADSKLGYLVRGGGIYTHIETENEAGTIIEDSGHGIGWQVEGGLSVRLGERFQLIPGIRYRSLSRDLTQGSTRKNVDLNYFSAGLGIVWNLN